MANSVLSRPMFNQSQTDQSVAPTSSGIGGMTTPDQNAQALRNMFAPQIPATPPAQSFPVPQAGYKRGGEVIDGVAHFADGNEVVVPPPAEAPAAPAAPAEAPRSRFYEDFVGGPSSVLSTIGNTRRTYQERSQNAPQKPGALDYFTLPSGEYDARKKAAEEYAAETLRKVQEDKRLRDAGIASLREEAAPNLYTGIEPTFTRGEVAALDKSVDAMPSAQRKAIESGTAYSPPPKPATDMELELQSIRARREQTEAKIASRKEESIKQREENKWMGILAAGLGMMAGKDRNALVNIGAGGQQGLATFAGLEKGRREEESTARREDLMRDQLAQQKEIAFAQLAKDPETVRTYAALGGWKAGDPPEKFKEAVLRGAEAQQLKTRASALEEYLKAARDPLSGITPEKAQRAQEELLRIGMAGGSGSGSPPGWSGRQVSPAPTR